MSLVSYSQNFEDVMLWRALRGVAEGFYVDIGAAWPDEHSVTRVFYDRGWSGINVEPNPRFHAELEAKRPRDRNLCVAVGASEHLAVLHVVDGTGLSSLDGGIAARYAREGRVVERREVPVTTLASLWTLYAADRPDVHFLKVDVEGMEGDVLRGADWSRNRPWVVVVEATRPMSQEESHQTWEPVLIAARYRFAYADGLNRFYVSEERAEALLPAFQHPPNCFDDFVPAGLQRAEELRAEAEMRAADATELARKEALRATAAEIRAEAAEVRALEAEERAGAAETRSREAWTRTTGAEARTRDMEARVAAAEARARESEARAAEARRAVSEMEHSLSWRATRPLRLVFSGARGPGRDEAPGS